MRQPLCSAALVLLVGLGGARADADDVSRLEHPLAHGSISLHDGPRQQMSLRARWSGASDTTNPKLADTVLRVVGGPGEGDSGTIQLRADRWRIRGKVFRYLDARGSAGGIRSIVLRIGQRGGRLQISAGRGNWRYAIERPQTTIAVTLTIGPSRWCAEFEGAGVRNGSRRVHAVSSTAPTSCPCNGTIQSTWNAIQTVVFERHGCTATTCHGSTPGQGNLDLRRETAYRSLVDVPSNVLPSQKRVEPGSPEHSLLWRKLAARTAHLSGVPLSPMPSGDNPALSPDELRAVEQWIYNSAPETGVVPGTDRLLASCLPPAKPQKIRPPDPPPPDEGVQLYGPVWHIPPHGEGEVCYARYYDLSGSVPAAQLFPCPAEWGGPDKSCFFYDRTSLTQDPNSHHSILRLYRGQYDITHPSFGTFTCHGGATDGTSCDPKGIGVPAPAGAECGPGSGCAGTVTPAIACLGYGPPDLSLGANIAHPDSQNAPQILISTEPYYRTAYPEGVSNIMPVSGILVVNSHAFNISDQPTTNEQWLNVYFSAAADRRYLVQNLFDATDIFIANVPPFARAEYCHTLTFEKGTRVFELYSHTHKRGRLFRAWGPGISPACTSRTGSCLPESGTPFLVTTDYANPDVVTFDPPLSLDADDPATRTIKYCAVYDNGATDPTTVKRRSTAPPLAGTCSDRDVRCLAGPHRGEACNGDDRRCDSTPAAHDGLCDACPLHGGVTTDDEMFVMLGSFFCPEGTSCYRPAVP
jgi:hypothetical protein